MPQYFCYGCQRTVGLRDGDFVCAACGSDFVEEVVMNLPQMNVRAENAEPQAQAQPAAAAADGNARAEERARAGAELGLNLDQWIRGLFNATGQNAAAGGPPMSVHVSIGPQGVVIQNGRGAAAAAAGGAAAAGQAQGGGARTFQMNFPDNFVDQIVGGNLPDFLTQILENNGIAPNMISTSRGFSEEMIRKYLPMSKVTQRHVDNGAQCTTCFDTFKLDDEVGILDCEHIFHRPCIEPWLKTKSSCPVCRQPVNMTTWKRKYDEQQNLAQFNVLEDLD